jgi:ABC-type antimicrobial peptide transport system permease subunit
LARVAQVLRLVLESGTVLAIAGVGIGIGIALMVSPLMRTLLHEISPSDPLTFVSVGGVLTVVAVLASLVPAWRATRVDPVVALKAE